ncbi:PREDICTED: probable serine/threonine-protein kinase abkC isoform X1 [Ipomoea nil]|uniref:probable serine/threonine-protein kinase abkC isoform X1 n=1 Tax=Ipomoea nil TaxID=35883 RepID=UPI0009014BDC|nr:PREDICTED: probable serine/threonine-protein kinase abkC isoform X1 [Ipomoea nil]
MAISRFLFIVNARRIAHSQLATLRNSCLEVWSPCSIGFPYIFSKLSAECRVFHRGFASCTSYKSKAVFWRSRGLQNSHSFTTNNKVSHHAQMAWKSLFQMHSCCGAIIPPLSRIACAISLALSRSHLVSPGILAFLVGKFTWKQSVYAESPIKESLYTQAKDGHIYLTSFVFSLLESLILLLRAVYLTILFSPCILTAPVANILDIEYRKKWLRLVRTTLEKAGPAFIKWGQWAATRPDLFPNDLCTELAELHSKAPAHSFSYTKRSIEKAFGRKLAEIFEQFEERPVASGSIAQVHRAILKFQYPRKPVKPMMVAVKVRHPGVVEAIRRDFVLIDLLGQVSKFIPTLKWLRLDESIQQFAVFMMSQVDLSREAANLSRFIYNFRRWKDVSFPKPLYPLVHPAVLVETFEHGDNVLHYVDGLEGQEHIKSSLAHIGTHALLKMLLVDNFIHADMHPGNILVRVSRQKAPSKGMFKSKPHVIFLDVGMTAELSNKDRLTLLEFFKAVAVRDGRTAAECTLRLSKQQKCPSPEAFVQEVEKTFNFWGTAEGGNFHPADCMHHLLEQVRRHRVNIDGNVCTVMVTTLVLEGWQRKLDPEYDVLQTLQTLLFKVDWAESLHYTLEGLMAP